MVSAGLDTVPGNLVMGLAYLASEDGMRIQKKAYDEIMKVYPENDAWDKCLVEEKVPYITALVKEILRFWTVIPICLPRKSIKDVTWNGVTIPAGTTFFMVSISFFPEVDYFANTYNRMPGQQTMTQHISKTPKNSSPNATSTPRRATKELLTTATAPDPACAPALISPIASYTQPLSEFSRLLLFILLRIRRTTLS
jgi:hypothetical protein